LSRTAWWISPVLLVDGIVAGTSSLEQQEDKAVITVEPFASISASTNKAAAGHARRYGRILGAEIELIWRT
jgi:DNA glycosylase AlkZ-like